MSKRDAPIQLDSLPKVDLLAPGSFAREKNPSAAEGLVVDAGFPLQPLKPIGGNNLGPAGMTADRSPQPNVGAERVMSVATTATRPPVSQATLNHQAALAAMTTALSGKK